MISFDLNRTHTLLDIQKYNGKNVEVSKIADLLFDHSMIVLVIRTVPISASVESKLRSSLKENFILMKKIKKKTPKIILKLSKASFLKNSPTNVVKNVFSFLQIFGGNHILVALQDFTHFLYFEKFFLPKFSKVNFFIFSVKISSQYFLADSQFYRSLIFGLRRVSYDLSRVKFFYFFQFSVITNFFIFFIFFKYQQLLYKRL